MSTGSVNNGKGNCVQKSTLGWRKGVEKQYTATLTKGFIYYMYETKIWCPNEAIVEHKILRHVSEQEF